MRFFFQIFSKVDVDRLHRIQEEPWVQNSNTFTSCQNILKNFLKGTRQNVGPSQ